jgi:hypothetical protein
MNVSLDNFSQDTKLSPHWNTFVKGNGALEFTGSTLRLINTKPTTTHYTNAQIDDYQSLARSHFLWRPPLQMTIYARFSHRADELNGTAGFGFWNDPFMMTGMRRPALPRAIWFFFSSPPSNIKLDLHTAGPGWKAGTLDAIRWPFFALLPTAPLAIPLMNINKLYRACWPIGQRTIHVSESPLLATMTAWHAYTIEWQKKTARFSVDGQVVLDCQTAPRGPLGFVMWLDNQFMEITPWGRFKYGLVESAGTQWLEIKSLKIRNL